MHLCLFEDDEVGHLAPLIDTRPVYGLRLGIRTLCGTIRDAFPEATLLLHARPLVDGVTAQHYDTLVNHIPEGLDVLFVNGRYLAEPGELLDRLRRAAGGAGRVFVQGDVVVAAWVPGASRRFVEAPAVTRATFDGLPEEEVEGAAFVARLWHLLDGLDAALRRDYAARTRGFNIYERGDATVYDGAHLVGGEHIYLAPGATVRPGAVLNAEDGPIFVGAGATIREHAVVHGPAFLGEKVVVNPGADIAHSAIGYWSKVGGEVHGTIFQALSNKSHPGHLGDALVGQWCNFGAGSDNSNLKNNYGAVRLYDVAEGRSVDTGRQFLGLVMGDHAKCGIGTMFNTGSVVGVFANLFGAGFQPNYVPPFAWGGPQHGFAEYRLDKALEVAEAVMARREHALTEADAELLGRLFEQSEAARGAWMAEHATAG